MAESMFEELCRFVGFGAADHAALRSLHTHAAPSFRSIADEFVDQLRQYPAAWSVLRGDAQIERLKVAVRAWLDRALAGPWNDEYFELRSRIGRVHVRVNLPQRYMFTAMSVIRVHLLRIAADAFGDRPDQLTAVNAALCRVLDLELAIMMQTYREDSLEVVRRIERVEKDLLDRRLVLSEQRYRSILENSSVMVIVLDERGHILLFNDTAEATTGHARNDVIGKLGVDVLFHPQDAPVAAEHLARAHSGRPPRFAARLVTHTGDLRWVRWHLTSLAVSGARHVSAIGADFTEERTLSEQNRRAESLAALGTLAAGLAHEIRNPLNAAQLQLTLLDRRIGRHDESGLVSARDSARLVREELARLAGLVSDFLRFARPSDLRIGPADACETIRQIAELMRPEVVAAGARLDVRAPAAPISARFDEERIKQAIINLVRNAHEAAGPGGEVALGLSRADGRLMIEVEDTGPGIADGIDIFEPFRTTKEQGTGLGLPIVFRIVTDHQGRIGVDRRGGRTVFTIELPTDGPR